MSGERGLTPRDVRERGERLLAADHFGALGVPRSAGPDDVRRAFVEAARTWHPDRAPPAPDDLRSFFGKVFARLELARNVLSDPARRVRYLEELASGGPKPLEVAIAEASVEFKKSEAFLKKNDAAAAERHLRRAVQLAPDNVEYQAALVALRAKPETSPDELKVLVAELDRLVARDATSVRAHLVRAQLKKRLGRVHDAVADFARVAELDPQHIDAVREVRLHKMRQEKAEPASSLDFLRKWFKR